MNEQAPIPTVLYVENDVNDVLLLKVAFDKLHCPVNLVSVPDGEKAQAYLEGSGLYADREHYPWPDLILMDLKMPRKSGFEVTQWIRAQPGLGALPVLILTSSEQPEDFSSALTIGANGFFIKPVGLEELEEVVRQIAAQWLHLVPQA